MVSETQIAMNTRNTWVDAHRKIKKSTNIHPNYHFKKKRYRSKFSNSQMFPRAITVFHTLALTKKIGHVKGKALAAQTGKCKLPQWKFTQPYD